jgi:hypothetical protein
LAESDNTGLCPQQWLAKPWQLHAYTAEISNTNGRGQPAPHIAGFSFISIAFYGAIVHGIARGPARLQ